MHCQTNFEVSLALDLLLFKVLVCLAACSGLVPLDSEYVYDIDFNDEEEDNLKAVLPAQAAAMILKNGISDKTYFCHVYWGTPFHTNLYGHNPELKELSELITGNISFWFLDNGKSCL